MRRFPLLALSAVLFALPVFADEPKATPKEGVLPTGADGKPLNFDFETGTLKDWTAEGDAFKNQPIKGDAVAKRRPDMKSAHQGDYWIGTYENDGDKPQGTLTSVPFKVTQPWASFLIGGGARPHLIPAWLRWDDQTVRQIAEGIHNESAFELLPILGDALEEAGCSEPGILDHCRGTEHPSGSCWVVDLIRSGQIS